MKLVYSAIALIFLSLLLSSNTDPFGIKTALHELFPSRVFEASSGVEMHVTAEISLAPDISSIYQPEYQPFSESLYFESCQHSHGFCHIRFGTINRSK